MLNFIKSSVFGSFAIGFAIGAALLLTANPMALSTDANAHPISEKVQAP